MPREQKPTFDPEFIRDISERVYRIKLEDSSGGGHGAVQRMLDKDADGGVKLRNRAGFYDQVTRAYLEVLGFTPEHLPKLGPNPIGSLSDIPGPELPYGYEHGRKEEGK
jgi:hypothetical protein